MQLLQSKIAACLITFKEVIEKTPSIPKTEKEKREFNGAIDVFLNNLAKHKKFQEIFGVITFGDSDLDTNLEFIKSMIIAQEEEIIERIKKDDEAAEAQRLEIDREKQKQLQEMRQKIVRAIEFMEQNNLPEALEIINESDDIREAVANHYNDLGRQRRTDKSYEQAVESYAKALSISPNDENLCYNTGRAYFEAGDLSKAEDYLAKAMKLNPEFAQGKLFYDYLLQLNLPGAIPNAPTNETKSVWQKIFFWRK